MTVKFSIITITRNNRAGLAKTAESVMDQTCTDYEWIIIDGASADGTENDFKNYIDARITSEPDSGIYDAMNKGIDKTTGDYLVFMNAGDQFAAPDTLEKIKSAICNNTYDLFYGDSFEGNEKKFLKRAKPHTTIERGMFTHHQAIFYNRQSLDKLRYDTNYKIAADYDLTLKFLKEKKRHCLYLPFPVCIFESGGISQRQIKQGRDEQFLARQKARIPFVKNWAITTKQKTASFFRRLCPFIYKCLKS
ncbi:MAG TPA: glycosyltransferase family 2 protein [Alphaproteobacteria bacterium]|nr:glycosyltransferase family 2 protein [Alphaproteobacteria bacterium]HNS43898.1 glycosyltransferase family 2 protein [Alphaproteobacteria bacterium]